MECDETSIPFMECEVECDDSDEEAILRCHLTNLEKTDDAWRGYLDSEENLLQLERDLLTIGVSFKTSNSHGAKSRDGKPRLVFSASSALIPITLEVPFRVLSIVNKGCLFGKDRHPKHDQTPSAARLHAVTPMDRTNGDSTFKKKKKNRMKLHGPKKKGCTATMQIKRIEMFPDFKVTADAGSTPYKVRKLKETTLVNLAQALAGGSDKTLRSETRVYIQFTRKSKHTEHDFSQVTAFRQTVHPDVSGRIQQLVWEGITSVQEVKTCLRYYVGDVIFAGKEKPDHTCRAFYPTTKDINNHVYAALKKQQSTNNDQEDALAMVDEPLAITVMNPGPGLLQQKRKQEVGAFREKVQNATNRLRNMAVCCTNKQKLEAAHKHLKAALELLSSAESTVEL